MTQLRLWKLSDHLKRLLILRLRQSRCSGTDMQTRSLSAVVPCYRSGDNLVNMVQTLHSELCKFCDVFEIILVNDGSPDNTWEVIQAVTAEISNIKGINLWRNFGQHNATLCGIQKARYDYIVTIDDDLQYSPAEIKELVLELDKGFDIVYGVTKDVSHGVFRALSAWIIRKILAFSGTADLARVTSFRAFRAGLKPGLSVANGRSICLDTLLCWTGSKIGWVQVKRRDRPVGESSYSFSKLVQVTFDLFLTDGVLSIKLLILVGIISLFLSFIALIVSLLVANLQIQMLLIFIALFLGGSQILALALIIEYQLRLSNSINCRLLFADREIVESGTSLEMRK